MKTSLLPTSLPPLRPDISITHGGTDFNKTPTWIIYDSHNNQHYQIGWTEYQILLRWHLGTPQKIIDSVNKETTITIDLDDIGEMLAFLSRSCLIKQSYKTIKHLAEITNNHSSKNLFLWLIHHYLFFRFPLIYPDQFLSQTVKYVKWVFHRNTAYTMLILFLIALYLISRQWNTFFTTFIDLFTLHGIIIFLFSIMITKLFHEFGHAYRCKTYGVKIPTMGIACMVLMPLLYTDTSESLKLASNKKRMMIALAGMQMEIYIAILAMILWNFLPPGPWKSTAFFISTISWTMSLFVNLTPFLRFDGYYILSDLLGVRNLQPRSFSITKWRIRKELFGLDFPPPEPLSKKQQTILLTYAISTWIYRFFLFLGIALLVYHLFFKALGLFLFTTQIIIFFVSPILKELHLWWTLRKKIKPTRNILLLSILLSIFFLILVIPWKSTLRLPATLSYQHQRLFAPHAAQINQIFVKRNDQVKKGMLLLTLHSPRLELDIIKTKKQIATIRSKLRSISTTQTSLQNKKTFSNKLASAQSRLAGLEKKQKQLNITAPFSGYIADLSPSLRHAMWISKNQPLLIIVNPKVSQIQVFAKSDEAKKITLGGKGKFIPENIDLPTISAHITNIGYQNIRNLNLKSNRFKVNFLAPSTYITPLTYHASTFGGRIAFRTSQKNTLTPEYSIRRIMLQPAIHIPLKHVERGVLFLKVRSESIITSIWKRITSVFIRESGF